MKKFILLQLLPLCLFSLLHTAAFAQCPVILTSSLTASNDTTLPCGTNCTNISVISSSTTLASTSTYSVTSIPYAPLSFTGGTATLVGMDDIYSGLITIPFPFCFFGTKYTKCVIGANGEVSFNAAVAGAYCPWAMSGGLPGGPTASAVRNCILGPYYDMDPALGGNIYYATYGTAPCRTFVVSWNNVPLFDGYNCPGLSGTEQIVMYESTNVIEINIKHRDLCTAWNGGYAITGINNATGTLFYTAPGENGTAWPTTSNQSWRFTPSAAPVWAYTWYSSLAPLTVVGTGSPINVCPPATQMYYVKGVATSNCDSVVLWDSVQVTINSGLTPNIGSISATNPTACGVCNGTITLHGVLPHHPDTVFYSIGGVPQPSFIDSSSVIDSTIIITGLCSGTYNNIHIKLGPCPSNVVGPVSLVTPVLAVSSDNSTNPTVCGKCDGTITLHGLWPDSTAKINFMVSGVAHAPFTGTVLPDSSITVPGLCAGNYTGITATIGLCTAPAAALTLTNPLPYPASLLAATIQHCNGDEVDVTSTSTPSGYNAIWDFNDGTPAVTAASATHIYFDNPGYVGTYTVTLSYNEFNDPACTTTHDTVISFNHPITAQITKIWPDTSVCWEASIDFYGSSVNTSLSTNYKWDFAGDGSAIANGSPAPAGSFGLDSSSYTYPYPGDYTVKLTVTDSIGCQAMDSSHIHVVRVRVFTSTHDTSVCITDSFAMHTSVFVEPGGYSNYTIAWTPTNNIGDPTSPSPNFYGVGEYVYTITVNSLYPNCTSSDAEAIHSYPPITLTNLTLNQTIPWGSSIQLNADGAVYYTWAPNNGTLDNPNINNPIATPFDSVTTYTVYGMSLFGCLDSNKITISLGTMTEFVPSAFTPNGDGLNDVFRITNLTFQKLVDFRVYNRWGQLVFQTANRETGWDGTLNGVPQDLGVYNYQITIALVDGTNKTYKGNVTLIR